MGLSSLAKEVTVATGFLEFQMNWVLGSRSADLCKQNKNDT